MKMMIGTVSFRKKIIIEIIGGYLGFEPGPIRSRQNTEIGRERRDLMGPGSNPRRTPQFFFIIFFFFSLLPVLQLNFTQIKQ